MTAVAEPREIRGYALKIWKRSSNNQGRYPHTPDFDTSNRPEEPFKYSFEAQRSADRYIRYGFWQMIDDGLDKYWTWIRPAEIGKMEVHPVYYEGDDS
jgi:hypothetical protein